MGKKSVVYPSKTTINLVIKEKSKWRPGRVLPMFLALAAAVVLFGKFAVADRLAGVAEQQRVLSALEGQIAALEQATDGYAAVAEEYGRYSVGWMTDEEKTLVDRVDILDLIQGELMAACTVRQFSVSANVLSADLSGISLEDTSRIVQRLYGWPEVSTVSVYSASTQTEEGEEPRVSMVITLALAEEGGGN